MITSERMCERDTTSENEGEQNNVECVRENECVRVRENECVREN